MDCVYYLSPDTVRYGYSFPYGAVKRRSYFFSYSYTYEWVKTFDNILAEVALDPGYITLSDTTLLLCYQDKKYRYALDDLQGVSLRHKRLIAPLIIGGIFAPLSLVAVFQHLFHPMIGILMCIAGGLLCYYGFLGTHQLTVHTSGESTHFFVEEPNSQLKNFAEEALPDVLKKYGNNLF